MSSAPASTTAVQFQQLPDENFYANTNDADEFMASFAQTTQNDSSDDDRPVQIMGNLMVSTTSTPRQIRNERRKMQRKKANPPLAKPATRKHPFWQLLSPEQYLELIGGWEWNLIATARYESIPPALSSLCHRGMVEALANGQLDVQPAGQSTSSEMDQQPSTLFPDVVFVQTAKNLVYETRYDAVVVLAHMMSDEILMLTHPPS